MPETPITPQTRVNSTIAGAQFAPAIAPLAGGGYIVIWGDSSSGHVYGQRYDANGQPVGGELDLADKQGGLSVFQSVAPIGGGGFVLTWQAGAFDSAEIFARRFDSSGQPTDPIFQVNSTSPGEQLNVHAVALDNGSTLFVWDTILAGSYQEVRGRIYDTSGQPTGNDFLINTVTADQQGAAIAVALPGGGFVAIWQSVTPAGGDNVEIAGQIFSAAGAKLGGEFQVNTSTANSQFGNDVARLSDGSFVVTWVDPAPNGGGGRILARHYDAAGAAVGGEIVIAAKASGGFRATVVTALSDGAYVVSWSDDDDLDNHVSARAMGADDVPLGDAFDISSPSLFPSTYYADGALTLPNGRIVFAWDGPSTNSGQDIYFRMYDITGAAPPSGEGGPGPDNLPGTDGDDVLNGNGGDDMLNGGAGNDTLDGGDGNDALSSGTGTDNLRGAAGDDSLYFGANLSNADGADGGDGSDTLIVQGNYAALALPATPGVEVLLVASGSDTRFGDNAGNSYDYVIAASDANVPAGGILTVSATGLLVAEDLRFDGSAETDGGYRIFAGRGADSLTGGGGSDGFFFGADGNLTGADVVIGGGGIDTLALRGIYAGAGAIVFQNGSFGGIEVMALLSGLTNEFGGPIAPGGYAYDLTLADGNIAAGARLDVNAVLLAASESVRLDARAELDGSVRILSGAGNDILFGSANSDTIYGGLGADAIVGDGGADLYLYRSALESTAAARDTLVFGAGDRIDLSFIDAIAGTAGVNDAFAFIGDAAFSAAGQLRAFQSGNQWIVEGEVDGDGVADLVIALSGAGPVTAADFLL